MRMVDWRYDDWKRQEYCQDGRAHLPSWFLSHDRANILLSEQRILSTLGALIQKGT